MSIEFVVEHHTGNIERLDRDELIGQLAEDYRAEIENEIDDRVSDYQSDLYDLSDDDLAKEHQDRTGELVRIEQSEEEDE
jgi:hypothetical protein